MGGNCLHDGENVFVKPEIERGNRNETDRSVRCKSRTALRASRADIEAELRSTLEDMLEDRSRKAGRAADEQMEKELLKEYGAPDKVAESYNPMPYLIGPRMFPSFVKIVGIALTVLVIVLSVLLGINLATQPVSDIGDLFSHASFLGTYRGHTSIRHHRDYLCSARTVVPASEFKLDVDREWNLMTYKSVRAGRRNCGTRGHRHDRAALIIFNGYPHLVGLWYRSRWTAV
jgi:hypothetical protein